MIRFVCKKLNQLKWNQDSKTSVCFLENPFLIRPIASSSSTNQHSFTISYLVNSCGLSEEKATSASTKVHFETSNKPDSVLTLFRNYGFTNTHISKIIAKQPLLLSRSENVLKEKIEFFCSMGISGPELANLLSAQPSVLNYSLEKQLIPSLSILKSFVKTEEDIIATLKRSEMVLLLHKVKLIVPNIVVLRKHGVPEPNILRLLKSQPRALLQKVARFNKIVSKVKEMGLDPLKLTFVLAIHGITSMSNLVWEEKWSAYLGWGWSEDEMCVAFRKQPFCMMASKKKIMGILDFLINRMGCNPSVIAKSPSVLCLSLDKRIIPRCSVIQVLLSKGLVKKDLLIPTVLAITDKVFLKKFVTNYEKEVPELLKLYHGAMRCPVMPTRSDGVGEIKMF